MLNELVSVAGMGLERKARNKMLAALQDESSKSFRSGLGGAVFGIIFKLFRLPVFCELTDGSYELDVA